MNNKAIGVFDSGIGGLTVYKELKEKMPGEKVVYLGDTARLPYGTKSKQAIIKFSIENAWFLLEKQIKIIVVACNSSSSHALPQLQDEFDLPVLGVIEPGAEAAVSCSRGRVGVIGTTATIMSGAYEASIKAKNPDLEIVSRDCPLFVPLIEEGWIKHPVTRQVIEEYLLPLKQKGIDSLVLGCTHYPVIKETIASVMGDEISLIDSAQTTAHKVHGMLQSLGWLSEAVSNGEDEFYVTDFPDRFKKVGEIFLQKVIDRVTEVAI